MHRFFVSIPLSKEITIAENELYHQLVHVFRAKIGDKVLLFSEGTNDFVYEIQTINKKGIVVSQKEIQTNQFGVTGRSLTVFQAYPNKLSTLEFLVQKCSELGVEKIVFWPSEHSQIQDISEAKKLRVAAIAREALEQCGGNTSLQIQYSSHGLQELRETYSDYTHIVGHYAGTELPKIPQETPIVLWIGPEGGWSTGEKSFFNERNMTLWKFNERVLRLETAAIVGAGILLS